VSLPKHILIVEDEYITQRYLNEILKINDVEEVVCLDNAIDVLNIVKSSNFDMILMDINIKGNVDGIQLAKKIQQKNDLPIVFISAYNDNKTIDEVLEVTPYGFISKPFNASDVIIALKIAYKKFIEDKKENTTEEDIVYISKKYWYDLKQSQLLCCDKSISLSIKQKKFIELLIKEINNTVSFESLTSHIWGDETISDSSLRTLVYGLRKKLPDFPIQTHSKEGYALVK
jgi:DNA-binding response OmpR family regulator